jgi:metal-dependent amidase/aminoacylase/carboxypeptidase family protein
VTVNDPVKAKVAAAAARHVAGVDSVDEDCPRGMRSEDFSYMLEKRPGAFIWIGNGHTAELHHPVYDFKDEALIHGIRYWTALVRHQRGTAP